MAKYHVRDRNDTAFYTIVEANSQQEAKSLCRKPGEAMRSLYAYEDRTPVCCPKCGGREIGFEIEEWFAHSLDSNDLHNTAELTEHHCRNEGCGVSFWL
jgi:hypothetical protein